MSHQTDLLKVLNSVARVYGEKLNFKTLSKSYLGKVDGLDFKEILVLFRQAGFNAFICKPNIKSDYPVLYWKDAQLQGYSVSSDSDVTLMEDGTSISNSDFKLNYEPELVLCVPPREVNKNSENILFGAFKHLRGVQFELIVIGFFVNLFALGLPLFTLSVYDRVLPTFATSTLWALTVGIAIILLLDFMFKLQKARLLSFVQAYFSKYQDENLLDKLLKIKSGQKSVGLQMEYFHMLQGSRDVLLMNVMPALTDLPFVFLFMGIIYLISPLLALVPLVLILLIFIVQVLLIPRVTELSKNAMDVQDRKESFLYEVLFANTSIRLTNATGMIRSKWRMYAKNYNHVMQKSRFWQQVGSVMVSSLAQISAVAVLVIGTYEVNDGVVTIGSLIACSILSGRAISPALSVADAMVKYQKVKVVGREIKSLEKLPVESWVQDDNCPEKILNPRGEVIFKGLYVSYPNMPKPALDDVNIKINSGERVAIVGRNGAGKSTLSKAVAGLVSPVNGQVMFDGVDLSRIPVTDLRDHVYLLEQSHKILSGSMKDVIVNDLEVDEERLVEAVKSSGLDVVLQQTGIGLEADIGENGCNLSGGQRQMLLLAQALYARPKVLIMDEPTSSFDHELELKVRGFMQKSLDSYKPTFILVTHRMNLLTLVDRLIVMDNGSVVMDGPKKDVLNKLNGKV